MSSKTKKRLPLGVVAFATALSLTTLTDAPAYASQWGESSTWNNENAGGQQVHSYDGMAEARSRRTGDLADVWVDDNGHVVVAINNGRPYTWWNSQTQQVPEVIWTGFGFRVFHTGTDDHIYYAGFEQNADGSLTLGNWIQVPNNVLALGGPAVTTLGTQYGEEWELAWRGLNNQVYAQYHFRGSGDSTNGSFQNPVPIPGAITNRAPAIADGVVTFEVSQETQQVATTITVAYETTLSRVRLARQAYGASSWDDIGGVPGDNTQSGDLSLAFPDNSNTGAVAATTTIDSGAPAIHTALVSVSPTDSYIEGWQPESTGWRGWDRPFLSVAGTVVFMLAADTAFNWFWKTLLK